MDVICYIYVGHVINPDVPTYGLPGDHIADKPGHTNRPHTTRTYRACHTYRARHTYKALEGETTTFAESPGPGAMSELQLIIGLLSTKPQICLHFDNFLFKHTSKPHICLHFDHFLSKPTQNLSSFPPVSIEGMWSSNEYGRSMSPDINMCPPHCP